MKLQMFVESKLEMFVVEKSIWFILIEKQSASFGEIQNGMTLSSVILNQNNDDSTLRLQMTIYIICVVG